MSYTTPTYRHSQRITSIKGKRELTWPVTSIIKTLLESDFGFIAFVFICGDVAERFKALVLKTRGRKARGFKSYRPRHIQGRALTISPRHGEPECYLCWTESLAVRQRHAL